MSVKDTDALYDVWGIKLMAECTFYLKYWHVSLYLPFSLRERFYCSENSLKIGRSKNNY